MLSIHCTTLTTQHQIASEKSKMFDRNLVFLQLLDLMVKVFTISPACNIPDVIKCFLLYMPDLTKYTAFYTVQVVFKELAETNGHVTKTFLNVSV